MNNNWYLFLRLHAIQCERLQMIYERAQIIATEKEFNGTFLDMLKNVLDGKTVAGNYEDSLRCFFCP